MPQQIFSAYVNSANANDCLRRTTNGEGGRGGSEGDEGRRKLLVKVYLCGPDACRMRYVRTYLPNNISESHFSLRIGKIELSNQLKNNAHD